jgi:hypothetical protein
VFVENDVVRFVYEDDVAEALMELGEQTTTRASYVEPGDGGSWYVDISPLGCQQVFGPFWRRDEALAFEKSVVEDYLANCPAGEPEASGWWQKKTDLIINQAGAASLVPSGSRG